MANDALKAGVKKVQNAFADQANAMLKKGVPFQVILTALANITLEMAMKIEKSGDSAAALKRLQDRLARSLRNTPRPSSGATTLSIKR